MLFGIRHFVEPHYSPLRTLLEEALRSGRIPAPVAPGSRWAGRRIALFPITPERGQTENVYFKLYREGIFQALRRAHLASRAKREARGLLLLEKLVANPVKVLAWGERRCFGLKTLSCIALREWPGALDLRQFTRELLAGGRCEEDRRKFLPAIGSLMLKLRKLHDAGCLLSDSYQKNLLYHPLLPPDQAIAWIDQPRLRRYARPLTPKQRAHDLACLDKGARGGLLTMRERLQAVRGYLQGAGAGRPRLEVGERVFLELILRQRRRLENQTFFAKHFRSRIFRRYYRILASRLKRKANAGAAPGWQEEISRG